MKIVKAILYTLIPAVVGACLCGADFIPLPDPQTRAWVGFVVFGAVGLWLGARRNFE